MLRKSSIAVATAAMMMGATGCTSYSVQYDHTSHPLLGAPLNDKPEWSTDLIQACARKKSRWLFGENCLGYAIADVGPDPLVVTFRLGVEFKPGE